MPQFDALPRQAPVLPHLFGRELFLAVGAARAKRGRRAQPHISACAAEQFNTVQRSTEQRAVAEAAIAGNQQGFGLCSCLVQTGSQAGQQAHGWLAQIVLPALLTVTLLCVLIGPAPGLLQTGSSDTTHRYGTSIHVVLAMERQQHTGL